MRRRGRTSQVALLGLLFALSVILGLVESSLSWMIPVPGIKPGLANIVTMFSLFCLGPREAYTLAGLRSFFVLLTRGVTASMISVAGGLLSVTLMLLLFRLPRRPVGLFISICGGMAHNGGQLLAAALVLQSAATFYYLPILLPAGAGAGILTGLLLRYLSPYIRSVFVNSSGRDTPAEEP